MQQVGHKVPGGFAMYEINVLDFDNQWWRRTDRWERIKVRRNLLLQPIPESASLQSLADNKGDNEDEQQRAGSRAGG